MDERRGFLDAVPKVCQRTVNTNFFAFNYKQKKRIENCDEDKACSQPKEIKVSAQPFTFIDFALVCVSLTAVHTQHATSLYYFSLEKHDSNFSLLWQWYFIWFAIFCQRLATTLLFFCFGCSFGGPKKIIIGRKKYIARLVNYKLIIIKVLNVAVFGLFLAFFMPFFSTTVQPNSHDDGSD